MRKKDFTTSTRQDTSYALLNIIENVRFVIEIPGYSNVNLPTSLEKTALKAAKKPQSVGCIACEVCGGRLGLIGGIRFTFHYPTIKLSRFHPTIGSKAHIKFPGQSTAAGRTVPFVQIHCSVVIYVLLLLAF